jgi:predicted nuclease of predicted toxin-antitoxin system
MAWVNLEKWVDENPPPPKEANEVFSFLAKQAKARFYADENFPSKAVSLLREMGARVQTANDAKLLGHPDENHLAYTQRRGLVLVTCDRDFLDERRFPLVHCPAIFVFNFGNGSLAEMRRAFRCLSGVFRIPQFYDKWCKVDATPECWIERFRFQNGTSSRSRCRLWRGQIQEWVV